MSVKSTNSDGRVIIRNGPRSLENRAPAQPKKAARKNASFLPPGNPNYRKWRDQFNPLRGLTIKKAIVLLEQAQRGIMAEYQWACRLVERRFPELTALISRRVSAIMEMDWEIKTVAPEDSDPEAIAKTALANKQAAKLREAYEGIGNLYEAIETLLMATFRGFGFCEKIVNPIGEIIELRPVSCWNLVKDGSSPRWKYNPDANNQNFESLPGDVLPMERFVWREVERPLNEIALVLFLRANHANKNWDAFLEIYGVPGGVVILPPSVPEDKQSEYQDAAKEIALGGSGSLPHGSDYKPNDGPRGTNPFIDHLKHVSEQLVLAGTGGKLTMLNDATGIGGSQGDVHADAFRQIAAADARDISELLQRQIDAAILDAAFPGQPRLAYFELNFREEVKATEIVDTVAKLHGAGFVADAAEISEKVGLKLTTKAEPQDPVDGKKTEKAQAEALANREEKDPLKKLVPQALTKDAAAAMRAKLPDVLVELGSSPELAAFFEEVFAMAFVSGAATKESE